MKPLRIPYRTPITLVSSLAKLECWNCTDGSTGSIPAGTVIELQNPGSATTTVVQVKEGPALIKHWGTLGLPLDRKPDGSPPSQEVGYRFIVNNQVLGPAIETPLPKRTRDLVGELIAYESGTSTPRQKNRLFGHLRRTGIGRRLQGHYSSRM